MRRKAEWEGENGVLGNGRCMRRGLELGGGAGK